MESIEQNENAPRKRMRLSVKPKPTQEAPQDEEKEESQENSTENTRKKILPNRINRGQRMKALQGKELEQHDELYDLIFGERSSDEDFAPSDSDLSDEESLGGKAQTQQEESREAAPEDGLPKNKPTKRIRISNKINLDAGKPHSKNKNVKEEIVDLDMIDLDKIDEMEDMRDKGIYPEEDEISPEEDEEDQIPKKTQIEKHKK